MELYSIVRSKRLLSCLHPICNSCEQDIIAQEVPLCPLCYELVSADTITDFVPQEYHANCNANLKFYCNDCEEMYCAQCSTDHASHKLSYPADVVKSANQQIMDRLNDIIKNKFDLITLKSRVDKQKNTYVTDTKHTYKYQIDVWNTEIAIRTDQIAQLKASRELTIAAAVIEYDAALKIIDINYDSMNMYEDLLRGALQTQYDSPIPLLKYLQRTAMSDSIKQCTTDQVSSHTLKFTDRGSSNIIEPIRVLDLKYKVKYMAGYHDKLLFAVDDGIYLYSKLGIKLHRVLIMWGVTSFVLAPNRDLLLLRTSQNQIYDRFRYNSNIFRFVSLPNDEWKFSHSHECIPDSRIIGILSNGLVIVANCRMVMAYDSLGIHAWSIRYNPHDMVALYKKGIIVIGDNTLIIDQKGKIIDKSDPTIDNRLGNAHLLHLHNTNEFIYCNKSFVYVSDSKGHTLRKLGDIKCYDPAKVGNFSDINQITLFEDNTIGILDCQDNNYYTEGCRIQFY
jgi:hypothetical protein